jgi:FkbM family methyltransferase
MPRSVDFEWLLETADNDETKTLLAKIAKWREKTLRENTFIADNEPFRLDLDGRSLWFRPSSAFSAVEVYLEIFKEDNHCSLSDFQGRNVATIIDIGANQGFYALKMAQRNPNCRIMAFEPNPYEYAILRKNIETNNLKNVISANMAVAPSTGTLQLSIIPQIGAIGGSDLKRSERPWIRDEFVEYVDATAVSIDDLFRVYEVKKADILKVDVEGLEFEILESCHVLDRVERMVVEYHSVETKSSIISLMKRNRFEFALEEPGGREFYGDLYFRKIGC